MLAELYCCIQQVLIFIKSVIISPITASWLTFFASLSLAVFAYLSWRTAKLSSENQDVLLKHQNTIQEKQHYLALLNEMLKNSEDFRQLILRVRKTIENEIYVLGGEYVSFDAFRSSVSKDWHIITRLGVLFGQDIRKEAKILLEKYLDSFPDSMIRYYGLIKNGIRTEKPTRKLSDNTRNKLLESHMESIDKLLKAGERFNTILNKLDNKISEVSAKLNPQITD